jgi:hypothetical protein
LTGVVTLRGVVDPADEAYADAQRVLRSALAGDRAGVAGAFDALVDLGADAAYDVAWCLAGVMVGDGLAPGPWRLDFPGIDDATYDARWVARFVTAYANADPATGTALFRAARADGTLAQCLLTLAGSAVATLRRSPP